MIYLNSRRISGFMNLASLAGIVTKSIVGDRGTVVRSPERFEIYLSYKGSRLALGPTQLLFAVGTMGSFFGAKLPGREIISFI